MKKLFTFVLALVLSLDVYSQFAWIYDTQFNFDYSTQLIRTKGGNYAMLHGRQDGSPERLLVLDGTGSEIFHFQIEPLPNSYTYLNNHIIDMPDSTLALAIYSSGVDTLSGNGWAQSYILKFDQNWNTTQLAINEFQYYRIIEPLADGSFVILNVEDNYILLTDSDGDDVWGDWLSYACNDMLVTPADSILIATQQGLLSMDKSGNIVSLYPDFVFEHIKLDGSGRIVGTTANSITLLSPDYQQIVNIDFLDEGIKDFAVTEDTVAILTTSNKVMLFENDLSFFTEFPLEGEEDYRFITVGNGRIALAGDEIYGDIASNIYTTTSFLKEYTLDGVTPIFTDDIRVVGMDLGSSVNIQHFDQFNLYRVSFPDANIMVRNFGESPIDQFYLRSPKWSAAFSNQTFLPGEDLNLPFPDLSFYTNENPSGLTYDVCAWTSQPNLSFDADASNDTYCTSFLVNDEEVVAQNSISIYPNPASDVVNFQLKTQQSLTHSVFRIVNTDGKVIKDVIPTIQETSFSLPVNDWAAGVYFLQFLEDGVVKSSARFVVVK